MELIRITATVATMVYALVCFLSLLIEAKIHSYLRVFKLLECAFRLDLTFCKFTKPFEAFFCERTFYGSPQLCYRDTGLLFTVTDILKFCT